MPPRSLPTLRLLHSSSRPLLLAACLLSGWLAPVSLTAQTTSTFVYVATGKLRVFSSSSSWVEGVAPNADSIATFNSVGVGALMQSNASVAGVSFTSTDAVVIQGSSYTLTIGSSGLSNTSTSGTKTISAKIALSADQTFTNDGTLTQSGTLNLGTQALIYTGTGSAGTISGVISGTGSLAKTDTGRLTLSATNTYTGTTTVTGGSLKVSGSLAASSLTTVNNDGTLTGTGTVGALTVTSGGILAPGNSPGTLNAGATTFAADGVFQFEVNNATGTAGTNWDKLAITGALTLSATSADPFILNLTSLDLTNVAGLTANFDSAADYAFTFVTTTGGISGFSADKFSVDTSAFTNPFSGTWSVTQTNGGNDLSLNYTAASAIPEPSTYAMIFGTLALASAAWRKRRAAR